MAFISFTYNGYDPATDQYTYTLVDSDFGAIRVGRGRGGSGVGVAVVEEWVGVAVVREYSKRSLPVGRNLALLVLYMHKERGHSIEDIKRWQDEYCPKYVENWQMYAKERDHHLNKLLAIM